MKKYKCRNSYRFTVEYRENDKPVSFQIGISAQEKPSSKWLAQKISNWFSVHYKGNLETALNSVEGIDVHIQDSNGEYVDSDEIYGDDLKDLFSHLKTEKLKQLFYESFKPHKNPPCITLSKKIILDSGFQENAINDLISDGFLEKHNDTYRMTYTVLKDYLGEHSWNWNNAWFGKTQFTNSSLADKIHAAEEKSYVQSPEHSSPPKEPSL